MTHNILRLWAGGGATLATYLLDGDAPRGAVVICPGGGYGFVSPREGEPVALQLLAAGFHAFVLSYSVAPAEYPQPLLDLARAVALIRKNAEAWGVVPDQIGVMGFSAGGHLTALLGVHWDKDECVLDGMRGAGRPNALMLCYPVISSDPEIAHEGSFRNLLGARAADPAWRQYVSAELQMRPDLAPCFLWHTATDQVVPPENSLRFAAALSALGLPYELHLYPAGGHGLSLGTPETAAPGQLLDTHIAGWMGLCTEWLRKTFAGEFL